MYIGQLIKDQPMTGLEKVVWWTEYVIRNRGAEHLKNPRAEVSWFEFLIIDVVAFLLSLFVVLLFAAYKISRILYGLVIRSRKAKQKSV